MQIGRRICQGVVRSAGGGRGNFLCGRTYPQRVDDGFPGRRARKITEMNIPHYALT
jgi:hypothetical protein